MSFLQDSYVMLNDRQSGRFFNIMLGFSQLCGAFAIIAAVIWMGSYENGFAWSDDPERQFHYHPTFMTMGLIFLFGEALLVYRVFRNERKRFSKLLHLVLHTMVVIFMVIALKAVWDSHDYHMKDGVLDPLPNLYSLHSWIGITVVVFYCLQYASGFSTFFFPGLSIPMRHFVMPFHQVFGIGIFCVAALTATMGISERAAWKHSCWTLKKELCGEQVISNILGLSIVLYVTSVVVIILNPRWRRRPLPEEESLHQLSSTE